MPTLSIGKQSVVLPTHKATMAIDFVRPLAEYNGANLQAEQWGFEGTYNKKEKLVSVRCGWCAKHNRRPIRACGRCKVILCGHAGAYVGGRYSTVCLPCAAK